MTPAVRLSGAPGGGHSAFGIDLYQLTTLCAHALEGRLEQDVAMSFFFRKLPNQRNYVLFCGRRSILDMCRSFRVAKDDLSELEHHPMLKEVFARAPNVLSALRDLDGFEGDVDALPEGTPAFAGKAVAEDGSPLLVDGVPVVAYTPLLQVRTKMTWAKLIETPWLSRINYMSMVASKAARVVRAAKGGAVLEFGQRRTHPAAALDASYAAYLAGCSHTSNVAAFLEYGIPIAGTMDHFAVQAAERPGVRPAETEKEFFKAFATTFPNESVLLVDTYDTLRGIRAAVEATGGTLKGIRLDSNVTPELVRAARTILDASSAKQAKIFVSDGLDEYRVRELRMAGADGFGVGENITCCPDAPTGVGAVAKLVENGYGKITMKCSPGSGKATLPGWLRAYRMKDRDRLALPDEPAPKDARLLLEPVWRGRAAVAEMIPLDEMRRRTAEEIARIPPHLQDLPTDHGNPYRIEVSRGLADLVTTCLRDARA